MPLYVVPFARKYEGENDIDLGFLRFSEESENVVNRQVNEMFVMESAARDDVTIIWNYAQAIPDDEILAEAEKIRQRPERAAQEPG